MVLERIANASVRNGLQVRILHLALINKESEGVLMIIIYDSLFGYVNIVFQLAFFLVISTKSSEEVYEGLKNMLGFSYLAIPTRHTVRIVPYLHGIKGSLIGEGIALIICIIVGLVIEFIL